VKICTYQFILADGNHHVSTLQAVFNREDLFVEMPSGDLPAGIKECFVSLLEYAEEELGAEGIVMCLEKDRQDKDQLIRTFKFLGFELAHPSRSSRLPKCDQYVFMAYSFE